MLQIWRATVRHTDHHCTGFCLTSPSLRLNSLRLKSHFISHSLTLHITPPQNLLHLFQTEKRGEVALPKVFMQTDF